MGCFVGRFLVVGGSCSVDGEGHALLSWVTWVVVLLLCESRTFETVVSEMILTSDADSMSPDVVLFSENSLGIGVFLPDLTAILQLLEHLLDVAVRQIESPPFEPTQLY